MPQPATVQAYRRLRTKYPYTPAREILDWVRQAAATRAATADLDFNGGDRAVTTRDGFDIDIRIVPDDDPDLSYLGSFDLDWDAAAVKIQSPHSGRYCYYHPQESIRSIQRGLRASHQYGRHAAWLAANSEVRRQIETQIYNRLEHFSVIVTAFKRGIALGSASLGGIEVEAPHGAADDTYMLQTLGDLIAEAVADARGTMDRARIAFGDLPAAEHDAS